MAGAPQKTSPSANGQRAVFRRPGPPDSTRRSRSASPTPSRASSAARWKQDAILHPKATFAPPSMASASDGSVEPNKNANQNHPVITPISPQGTFSTTRAETRQPQPRSTSCHLVHRPTWWLPPMGFLGRSNLLEVACPAATFAAQTSLFPPRRGGDARPASTGGGDPRKHLTCKASRAREA